MPQQQQPLQQGKQEPALITGSHIFWQSTNLMDKYTPGN